MAPVVRSVGRRQVVRSGTVKSRTVATKESILRIASQCIDAEKQPYDEITMDAMNIVHQFRNNLIEAGGQEQYLARIKAGRLHRRAQEGGNFRLPSLPSLPQ